MAFHADGSLYVTDEGISTILVISGFQNVTLTGMVLNQADGSPLPAAHLRVVQAFPPFSGLLVAPAADGSFSVQVAPDEYTITAWADGFQAVTLSSVAASDTPQQVQLMLQPAPGSP